MKQKIINDINGIIDTFDKLENAEMQVVLRYSPGISIREWDAMVASLPFEKRGHYINPRKGLVITMILD